MVKINNKSNLKINYIYNLLYQILILLVPLVTTPYISRVLGADGIGIYSYTLSIVTFFSLIGGLGISSYGQLQIASNRENNVLTSYLFWELTILRFISMGISIGLYLIFVRINDKYTVYYLLLLIYLVSCSLDLAWFLQGMEEFKKIVFRNTIIKLLCVALIFIFVREKNDLYKYVIIMQGSSLIGNIILFPQIKKYLVKINFRKLQIIRHLKLCIVYFIPTVATTIYLSIDKSMIGFIVGSALENGYYEQANKIEQVIVTVVTSLSVIMLPRMAYLFKNGELELIKKSINNSIKFVLCISIPMAVGLNAIAKILVPWFLGPGFEKCINLLYIFSCLIVIVGLNNVVGKQVLMASGKQKEYNYSVIAGAIINVIINLILIPIWGSKGAAIASVCAETGILLLFIKFAGVFVSLRQILKDSKKYIIGSTFMFIILEILNKKIHFSISALSLFIQIIIGGFTYFVVLIILKDKFLLNQLEKVVIRLKNIN